MLQTIPLFLTHCRLRGIDPKTISGYRTRLQCFQLYFADRPHKIRDLAAPEILAFLEYLQVSDTTRAGYWRVIRAYCHWCARQGFIDHSPALDLRPRFEPARRRPIPPRETLLRLIDSIDQRTFAGRRDAALLAFLLFTGARISEALGLLRREIDLDARVAVLRGKGRKIRAVPLARPLCLRLVNYLGFYARMEFCNGSAAMPLFPSFFRPDRPIKRGDVSKRWRALQIRAGVPAPCRLHDLRHACATELYDAGADLGVIQRLLGHASIETTQIYAHLSTARVARAVDDVFK